MADHTNQVRTLAATRAEFARKLQAELSANGWSQADLVERAKTVAESEKAALQAYDVSNYIRGRSLPRPEKLATIARLFRTTPEALLPNRGVAPSRSSSPMEMRQGEDGNVWLRLERVVSYPTALAIMKLLADEDGATVVIQPSTGEDVVVEDAKGGRTSFDFKRLRQADEPRALPSDVVRSKK